MKSLIQTETQFSGSVYLGDNTSDIHYTRGSIYFGDGGVTNYSKFDNTGKLTITGSGRVYNTIYIPAYSMMKDGVNEPSISIYQSTHFYEFSVGSIQYLYFNTILPNDYAEGTDVAFSIYYMAPTVVDVGDIKWIINYNWANMAGSLPNSDATEIQSTIEINNRYLVSVTPTISGVGKKIGSVIRGNINRDDEIISFENSILLLGIGINYMVDSLGSTNRTTK